MTFCLNGQQTETWGGWWKIAARNGKHGTGLFWREERERQTDRQTDRGADRQTQTDTLKAI